MKVLDSYLPDDNILKEIEGKTFVESEINKNSSIIKATKLGIIQGVPYDEENDKFYFYPNNNITREGVCTIISKILYAADKVDAHDFRKLKGKRTQFKDDNYISDWAIQYVNYLTGKGLINGKSKYELAPKDELTREEAITIVARVLEYLQKQ